MAWRPRRPRTPRLRNKRIPPRDQDPRCSGKSERDQNLPTCLTAILPSWLCEVRRHKACDKATGSFRSRSRCSSIHCPANSVVSFVCQGGRSYRGKHDLDTQWKLEHRIVCCPSNYLYWPDQARMVNLATVMSLG